MRTTVEAAEPPSTTDRVRRARSFKRPVALWFTALLFVIAFAGFVFFAVFAARMLVSGQRQDGILALAGIGVFLFARIAAAMKARSLTCHLCHGPVLQEKRCHKHPAARKLPLLGYRSLVVLGTLLLRKFRCIYCGSVFKLGAKSSSREYPAGPGE